MNHHTKRSDDLRPYSQDRVLATDLDGTLIPLAQHPENVRDLRRLKELVRENPLTLVYVTGRHLASVLVQRTKHDLPCPDWILCDVGTTIYRLDEHEKPQEVAAYREHLSGIIAGFPMPKLRESLAEFPGLRLQEEEKQGPFKLSYYADAAKLEELSNGIRLRLETLHAPYSLIASVDPFNGEGLLDLLPEGVSKAYALKWWADSQGLAHSKVVFAGDSGNDLAALTAGFCAILVSNAHRGVAREAYDQLHSPGEFAGRLYLAKTPATSGVLEGCRWFHLFSDDDANHSLMSTTAYPLGATPLSFGRTHFRVWAPERTSVAVELYRGKAIEVHSLTRNEDGYWTGTIEGAVPGDRYRYRLDDRISRPDPISRFQPEGVHGPSLIIDPNRFPWSDQDWQGTLKPDLVIYEMHIGTFTTEGTFRAAVEKLQDLKDLGITALEILPVAQTAGKWNWGYDGVNLFAVRNTYGTPDDFKVFIDACHRIGIAVILDVVYNHLGPEGNYWRDFAPYYSTNHHTPWGDAFAFDGPDANHVRKFVVDNALFWLREYHLDGLRLDAVHCMYDDSQPHILEEIREAVQEFRADHHRAIHLIAEANRYDPKLIPPQPSLPGYDASWEDDIMHSIYSVITPETNVTHRAYVGPTDLAEALDHGFLYTGMPQQRMNPQLRAHISSDPKNLFRSNFIIAVQTHDNVGNQPHGKRIHHLTSPAHQKAAAALVLLYPAIPMIFMGEEFASTAPFRFFVDFEDQRLRRAVDEGRAAEYPMQVWEGAISPSDERAFRESQLHGSDDPSMFAWYRSLLDLRRTWREQGILTPESLKTFWKPEAKVFGYSYSHPHGDVFVLSRLFPLTESPKPISVRVQGKLLLDSGSDSSQGSEGRIDLPGPGAIIGQGTFQITIGD